MKAFALAGLLLCPSLCDNAARCPVGEELANPDEIPKGSVTLEVRQQLFNVPTWLAAKCSDGSVQVQCCMRPSSLRTYMVPSQVQPALPGPTLRLRKGDALQIHLINNLPAAGGENVTNLHFHGLHVSPQGSQDNVLVEVRPQGMQGGHHAHARAVQAAGSHVYSLDPIREEQSEGTHWYHPHRHGSVALQVANGMAGALIVEGPFDDWLKSRYPEGLKEKVLVLQHIRETAEERSPAPLVNGQAAPAITLCPGEIQRWRLLNASGQESALLAIDFDGPVQARQLAMDGVRFSPANYRSQPFLSQGLRLAPGNRADLLVRAPEPIGDFGVTANGLDLVTVRVRSGGGCPRPMSFPEDLPPLPGFLADVADAEVVRRRDLSFDLVDPAIGHPVSAGFGPAGQFQINLDPQDARQFDPSCVDITTTLNTAEEWTIRSSTSNGGLPFHVFHIHTNPFQVLSITGPTPGKTDCQTVTFPHPVWQDTIALPSPCTTNKGMQPGQVVIRQRYRTFTGEYVLHCHFLEHEDRGMMLAVQTVCPAADGSLVFSNTGPNVVECAPGFTPRKAGPLCPMPKP